MTVSRVLDAIRAEFGFRATLTWQVVARMFTAAGADWERLQATDVKALVIDGLTSGSPDLLVHYQWLEGIGHNVHEPFSALSSLAIERVSSDIELAFLEGRRRPPQTSTTTFNIYQPFGIIQTGEHARATLSVHPALAQQLTTALEKVELALTADSTLAARERAEAVDLVQETKAELAKATPNLLRLRGTLSAIAATVQTLGSAAAAYQLLKGAAALAGLHLP